VREGEGKWSYEGEGEWSCEGNYYMRGSEWLGRGLLLYERVYVCVFFIFRNVMKIKKLF